jgi:hypothetical protein
MEKEFEVFEGDGWAGITLTELGVDIACGNNNDYDNNGHVRFSAEKFEEFVKEVNNAWYAIKSGEADTILERMGK